MCVIYTIQRILKEKILTKEFPRFLDDFPGLIFRQVPVVIAFILEWSVQHSNLIRGNLDEPLCSDLSTSIRIRLKRMITYLEIVNRNTIKGMIMNWRMAKRRDVKMDKA